MIIIKADYKGNKVWQYEGKILAQQPDCITIEARFNRQDLPFYGIVFKHKDKFIETFYSHKWYNIFEIHDRDDNHLKGWYCNVTYPAEIMTEQVIYRDLALDLLVYPDGRQLVLDEDEFLNLELNNADREAARHALKELQVIFATWSPNRSFCFSAP